MADRKRRKKNKLRGQRTMGAGNTKNRRGAGCRGGRGNAGANKSRFHSIGRLKDRKYRLKHARKLITISVGKLNLILNELVAKGKATKEGEKYIVDKKSGYQKVLSEGKVTSKIVLKINASKEAIKKIKAAGGKFDFAKEGIEADEKIVGDEEDEDLEFESAEGEINEKE
ncbi:MAG: uL15m family ribosomal protein [archaeon]|jgi:large subunit ribosomal protein L15